MIPVSILEQKAYSQSNDFRTDYFAVDIPDGWTQVQADPIDGVETASAAQFCPPEGCGEAEVQLFAYLPTSGSFFPTGRTAQPKDVFQGIIDYNEGIGVHAIEVTPIETPDPQVAVRVETTDDQGQKWNGMSFYQLSEQRDVLWERTFYAKEGSGDHYWDIFPQIQRALKLFSPNEVPRHENLTPQYWKNQEDIAKIKYCSAMAIIWNMRVEPATYKVWDEYCQMYHYY